MESTLTAAVGLSVVIATDAASRALPAASVAVAVSAWEPSATVALFHETE